jgi:hypothetical protein
MRPRRTSALISRIGNRARGRLRLACVLRGSSQVEGIVEALWDEGLVQAAQEMLEQACQVVGVAALAPTRPHHTPTHERSRQSRRHAQPASAAPARACIAPWLQQAAGQAAAAGGGLRQRQRHVRAGRPGAERVG